jgi:hypothetical protein
MTPQELAQLIEDDIASNQDALSWRGRPFRECLQEPKKVRVLNSHNNNEPEDLWLVFEEVPNAVEGYKVVYDESLGEFGLAVAGITEPVLIGIY